VYPKTYHQPHILGDGNHWSVTFDRPNEYKKAVLSANNEIVGLIDWTEARISEYNRFNAGSLYKWVLQTPDSVTVTGLKKSVDELDAGVRMGAAAILLASIVATVTYFSMMYQIFWGRE